MKAMTAVEAKNSFGKFLDSVQREPVIITKKNRAVGMTLSMQDIEILFGGDETFVERALEESRIDKRLTRSRQQVINGKTIRADENFFESVREIVRSKYPPK